MQLYCNYFPFLLLHLLRLIYLPIEYMQKHNAAFCSNNVKGTVKCCAVVESLKSSPIFPFPSVPFSILQKESQRYTYIQM